MEVDICFNNYVGPKSKLINMLIVIMKQYIYSAKCLETELNYVQFMKKVFYWYQIEKLFAEEMNKVEKFTKLWQDIYY